MFFMRTDAIPEVPAMVQELDHQLLEPLFRKYAAHPAKIVHYTAAESLEAILSSRNLRMTHFRHLNDSTEMLRGRAIVNELFAEEVGRKDETSQFFDFCRFSFNEVDDNTVQYFLSSFSVLPDDAELWARYGVRGAGVAVMFDTIRMGATTSDPFEYHVGRVTYTSTEQRELLSPLVQATKQVLIQYVRRFGYHVLDGAVQMLAAKLCAHLNHHSISLKDSGWSVELEWRTVFSLLATDPESRKARVALRSDGRPYIDVPVRSAEPYDECMPIVAVIAGAAADVKKIRAMLDSHGYEHVPITRSALSVTALPKWPRDR